MIRTTHSILRPDDLRDLVARKFGTSVVASCQLQRSFINDVYRLEARGRTWFLRVSPSAWRTVGQVEAEIGFLRALRAAGASTIEPVPLMDGTGFVLELDAPEGPRVATLFAGASGSEPLFTNSRESLAVARRYGRVTAELHVRADGLPRITGRPSMDLDSILQRPLAIVAAQLERPHEHELLASVGERLMTALSQAPLTFGFAHGDLNSSNVLFDDDRETVIDFDCCGWGYRANELAAFARGVTLSRMPGADASALIAAQLGGYVEIAPVSAADAAAIPAFLIVQRLWMASIHYERQDRFGLASFGPAYTARLIDWLRSWQRILEERPDWLAATD